MNVPNERIDNNERDKRMVINPRTPLLALLVFINQMLFDQFIHICHELFMTMISFDFAIFSSEMRGGFLLNPLAIFFFHFHQIHIMV
jgi:hypothetical protein